MIGQYKKWRLARLEKIAKNTRHSRLLAGEMTYTLHGGDGPVVLYLHGSPGGCDHARFRHKDYRTLAPSRPGYLSTPLDTGRTPKQQATAYAQLLDELGVDSVIVMAASGGGPSGLAFASMYPERVLGLIVIEAVSASLHMNPTPGFLRKDWTAWTFFRLLGPKRLLNMMVPDPGNQARISSSKETLDDFMELMWGVWPPSLRMEGLNNDREQFTSLNLDLEAIQAPTLIVHGTADRNVPFSQSQSLARVVPNARLHAIEGGDHFMPISHREELRETIEAFLKEL